MQNDSITPPPKKKKFRLCPHTTQTRRQLTYFGGDDKFRVDNRELAANGNRINNVRSRFALFFHKKLKKAEKTRRERRLTPHIRKKKRKNDRE